MTTYPLAIPDEILEQARRAAEEDGVSMDQLLSDFVSDGLGQRRGLAAIRQRAAGADVGAALAILDRVPDVPPEKGDAF